MRVALAQINPVVGDLLGNADRILQAVDKVIDTEATPASPEPGPALMVTPELSASAGGGGIHREISCSALLTFSIETEGFETTLTPAPQTAENLQSPRHAADGRRQPTGTTGQPWFGHEWWSAVGDLYKDRGLRGCSELDLPAEGGTIPSIHRCSMPSHWWKPEDGVWQPANSCCPATTCSMRRATSAPVRERHTSHCARGERNWRIGLTICEDLWVEDELHDRRLVGPDPVGGLIDQQIDLLINCSASPFGRRKAALRQRLAFRAEQRLRCPVVYVNQVGGNDELVFDGASFVMGSNSETPLLQLPSCVTTTATWNAEGATNRHNHAQK